MSPDCKELIKKMLTVASEKRCSLLDVQRHSWCRNAYGRAQKHLAACGLSPPSTVRVCVRVRVRVRVRMRMRVRVRVGIDAYVYVAHIPCRYVHLHMTHPPSLDVPRARASHTNATHDT